MDKYLMHTLIGVGIYGSAFAIDDIFRIGILTGLFAMTGFIYGGIALFLFLLKTVKPMLDKKFTEKALLKNKELLDKGIFTEEEYANKMAELKKKL